MHPGGAAGLQLKPQKRWKLLAVAAVLLVPLVVAVAVIDSRNRPLREQLVREVNALSVVRERPTQRESGKSGTFEECVAPLLDAMPDGGVYATQQWGAELATVRSGDAGVSTLDPALQAEPPLLTRR